MSCSRPQSEPPPQKIEIVAIAGSAGGLVALREILAGLPAEFPAPILVMLHLDPEHRSILPDLLARVTPLAVEKAEDGTVLQPGRVYVAIPARHLEVDAERRLHLADTARVHFARPSADRLFESAAAAFGAGTLAVICSGSGRDGATGMAAVLRAGGRTLAQSPETSAYTAMPAEAIAAGAVQEVLPLEGIATRLIELAKVGRTGSPSPGTRA